MKVLFPCHELEGTKVDDCFVEEHHATKLHMHDCYFFSHDEFVRGKFKSNIPQSTENGTPIILRSWMLSVTQYEELFNKLKEKGYVLINTPEQYKNCHYFPSSYDYVKDLTSKAIFVKEWDESVLQNVSDFFGGKDFLMKDFVKSAKDVPGLFRMSGGISGTELLKKVEEFVEHRGKLFSEGLVFKEFVELKKYSDSTNEWRIFYYENRLISCSQNSNLKPESCKNPDPSFLKEIAFQIDSNFFTIDVAEKEDGGWMIIETGDGQVSGLSPGQNCLEFYAMMQEALKY
ncbi:MAG: ATP-grasp domain-containing protein [Nanoarchaeota archaeon]